MLPAEGQVARNALTVPRRGATTCLPVGPHHRIAFEHVQREHRVGTGSAAGCLTYAALSSSR
jgi:hypothetical protein